MIENLLLQRIGTRHCYARRVGCAKADPYCLACCHFSRPHSTNITRMVIASKRMILSTPCRAVGETSRLERPSGSPKIPASMLLPTGVRIVVLSVGMPCADPNRLPQNQ